MIKTIYQKAHYRLPGNGPLTVNKLKQALVDINGQLPADIYGQGPLIKTFEEKFARLLGQPAAVFFPSGVMATGIALRLHADQQDNRRVAYHPLAHAQIHEYDSLKYVHHLEPILLGEANRLFTLTDLQQLTQPVGSLLIELPQREIGGQLPPFDDLLDIINYAKQQGFRLHLDGARLLESLPYYQHSAADIGQLFDTVYLSFYKGLGGIAGAILAGNQTMMEQAKQWKRRLGGDLISLYPYILSADYYYNLRHNKMTDYHHHAITLAQKFNQLPFIHTVPLIPQTNMFHLYWHEPLETIQHRLTEIHQQLDLSLISHLTTLDSFLHKSEISIGDDYSHIPPEKLSQAFSLLKK